MQGYVHDGPIINSAKRGSELTLSRMTPIVNQASMEILEKDNCSAHRLGAKLQQVPREAQSIRLTLSKWLLSIRTVLT